MQNYIELNYSSLATGHSGHSLSYHIACDIPIKSFALTEIGTAEAEINIELKQTRERGTLQLIRL